MSDHIEWDTRPARDEDFATAELTYIDAMRLLMVPLGCWNENERRTAFGKSYKASEVRFIIVDGRDVGWLQVIERADDFNLAQIQIYAPYRNRGIAAHLIKNLQRHAAHKGKSVTLSAVRNNRAIRLYRRLGFHIVDPSATPILDMVYQQKA